MDTWTISREIFLDRLAYSIGFFLGDGCLYSTTVKENGKTYPRNVIFVAKPDIECIERIQAQFEDVWGKRYAISTLTEKTGRKNYRMTAYQRDIFDFFAVNTAFKTKIPASVFAAEPEIKREVIAGLMDSDGFISKKVNPNGTARYQLGFECTDREIVGGLAALMQSVGVKVGSIGERQRGEYRPSWHISPNIASYQETGCYFYNKRRIERMSEYLGKCLRDY